MFHVRQHVRPITERVNRDMIAERSSYILYEFDVRRIKEVTTI